MHLSSRYPECFCCQQRILAMTSSVANMDLTRFNDSIICSYMHACTKMAHSEISVAVRPCGMINRKLATQYLYRSRLPPSPSGSIFTDSIFQQVCQCIVNKSVGKIIWKTVYAIFDGRFPCSLPNTVLAMEVVSILRPKLNFLC